MKSAATSHDHELPEVDAAFAAVTARIAALEARVAALEPTPEPPPPPPTGNSVRVTTIAALLAELANDARDEIVVADGTYVIPGASSSAGQAGGLWIDGRFAKRTRPVLVRAETTGGVTFSGGGARYWIGLAFLDGVHDQTWQGFRFADAEPTGTGVVVFGWSGSSSTAAPHHVTLRDIAIDGTIISTGTGANDHGIYFSQAVGGPHDLLIDGLTVDGAGKLDSALHFYHSTATEANAWNVTVRRMRVSGTEQAVILWDRTLRGIVIEDSTISGARIAVRYEQGGTVTLRRVTSTASGQRGFYSSLGTNPPGVTFIDCDLR